jgi:hypothetical protein
LFEAAPPVERHSKRMNGWEKTALGVACAFGVPRPREGCASGTLSTFFHRLKKKSG